MEIEPEKESPQGGIVSPLLANIYLNPLDWLMAEDSKASGTPMTSWYWHQVPKLPSKPLNNSRAGPIRLNSLCTRIKRASWT